ncbi:MAG TPA: DUF2085 domain-containing protein [Thermoanaerobaculia bacterium]|jgi:uncharacterized membrane protein
MKRDTKILLAALAPIPVLILSFSALASYAMANGASPKIRWLFRIFCHGMAERSLLLFDVAMPICARCTGIYIGLLAGFVAFLAVPWVTERFMRVVAFAAVTPLAIDGLTQLARLRTSTNPLRMTTGLIAGLAFGLWILSAVQRGRDSSLSSP